jgi:hypothetical protein
VGYLDEAAFAKHVQACPRCGADRLVVHSYLDRAQTLMVGQANDEGRWAYDGEGFIDGVYRIECGSCGAEVYGQTDCTRCHASDAMSSVMATESRLVAPKKCPKCQGLEMSIIGFAPGRTDVVMGRPAKTVAKALFGDPGFHVVAVGCSDCDWAVVAEGCPMCGAPSPIRRRPG